MTELRPFRALRYDTARVELPPFDPRGLYTTAVIEGDRLCATYCAGLSVVCGPAPSPAASSG